jgi:hypothetical protein
MGYGHRYYSLVIDTYSRNKPAAHFPAMPTFVEPLPTPISTPRPKKVGSSPPLPPEDVPIPFIELAAATIEPKTPYTVDRISRWMAEDELFEELTSNSMEWWVVNGLYDSS